MPTIVDSYSESNSSADLSLGDGNKIGQSFTGNGNSLNSCKFLLEGLSAVGSAIATVYAHTGTFGTDGTPTGSVLATSDSVDISTITSPALTTFTFTGADKITSTNGTKYFIVFELTLASGMIIIGRDQSSPTHSGNYAIYISSWTAYSDTDLIFYVYGNPVLICSAGSFTLTGQDTSLRLDRKIALAVGNFALTGIDVGLLVGKRMLLECGEFVLTGKDVGLRMARKLVCACGNFTLTGIAVGLKKGYTLILECGKFILTGIDVKLDRGWMRKYSEKAGSFTRKYAEKVGSWINKY